MVVHLIDGTYELFRYFYSPAAGIDRSAPEELRAVHGVVASVLGILEGGVTHLGVATDHVIESFRNALWPDYKTGEGLDPLLYAQFEPLEEALSALGVVVWAMVEFEADDALATAADRAAADARVTQVVVCSPDKDLAQCVRGDRIVQLDRRTRERRDEAGVQQEFGVPPTSIPDWLALVGDSADGYPGLPGWGPKSAATVLARYGRLEHIPPVATAWDVSVRGSARLAATLAEQRERALLFRRLATLRTDAPVGADLDALRWGGPPPRARRPYAERRLEGADGAQDVARVGSHLVVAAERVGHGRADGDDDTERGEPSGGHVRILPQDDAGAEPCIHPNTKPEPDVCVVPGSPRDHVARHPTRPALIVEVAQAGLALARGRKAAAYARAGIGDYWIVNLVDHGLEVHREPARPGPARRHWGYAATETLGTGATITPLAAPSARIPVADLLP